MKKWIRRAGVGAGTLVLLALLMAAGVYGFSTAGVRRTYAVTDSKLVIPTDSASIAWGRHLAIAIGKCVDCHGPDLAGTKMIDDPAFGSISSSNLTSGKGGIGSTYSDEDFVRALRHGVRPDGTPLLVMPSQEYTHMTDTDMASLVAYLRTLPPVDKEKAQTRIGPLARALYVAKLLPLVPAQLIDHKVTTRQSVAVGPTREYGAYLARIGGCQGCHGENLSGGEMKGHPPGTPPAANLTPAGLGKWTIEDFTRALRQGTRPDGKPINPLMPFVYTAQMSDDEIAAVWAYLQSIPAVETSTR
jgi:mono/diheme cytochrome c family protein